MKKLAVAVLHVLADALCCGRLLRRHVHAFFHVIRRGLGAHSNQSKKKKRESLDLSNFNMYRRGVGVVQQHSLVKAQMSACRLAQQHVIVTGPAERTLILSGKCSAPLCLVTRLQPHPEPALLTLSASSQAHQCCLAPSPSS